MTQRLAIYPYAKEAEPIARHADLLKEMQLTALISPRSFGYVGSAVALADGEALLVTDDIMEAAGKADVLLVPEFSASARTEAGYIDRLCRLAPHLRTLLCAARLRPQSRERLAECCAAHGCALRFPTGDTMFTGAQAAGLDRLELLTVPIVLVAGMWEGTDKFEVSLSLRQKLLADGYRVSQIGARSYCELFGFHSFPAFMYDPTVDETQKILLFNRFVYAVCREEKPDILLLTIPGGIQGLNERHPNGFGMLAFQVSKAVTADYLALCTFYETRVNAFAEMVRTACQYKLGRAVDCFHMSNIFINLSRTEERDAVQLDTVSREMVDKELRSKQGTYTRPIVNALEPEGLQALYDSVIQTLASDNDVMN